MCIAMSSKPYFVVLDAWVEIVRPRIPLQERLRRLLDSLVGQDVVPIDWLAADGASIDPFFIKVAILILPLLLCSFRLHFKVLFDNRSLKCLSALNQDGVSH